MRKHFLSLILIFTSIVSLFAEEIEELDIDNEINQVVSPITKWVESVVFYSLKFDVNNSTLEIPIIIIWLIVGALIFTFYFRFANIRLFRTSLRVVSGKYTDPEEEGEVSHFQALTAALSGTVGLGNISGVAAAISLGGPGATFWMIVAGLLGMSSKFVECTLGVKYRKIDADGTVHGGPMYYLSQGLKLAKIPYSGKVLAFLFAGFCVLGSFGGGNMFQANQAFSQFSSIEIIENTWIASNAWFFGLILAILVGIVILGGIKSIAKVTDKVVPGMVGLYVLAALYILAINFKLIPTAFGLIVQEAFNPASMMGGFIGVMIVGFQRAAFSNEAGVGSAPIAHSAVKTRHAASEGIVALLEPLIDTVIVCTMTALVLVITGYYTGHEGVVGIKLTSQAFDSQLPGARYIIVVAAVLFAFSTMISWSYYGLQAWQYIFGTHKFVENMYKAIFCIFIVIGASASLDAVIVFSDCMIFAMSVPNIIGMYYLLPVVKAELSRYLLWVEDNFNE